MQPVESLDDRKHQQSVVQGTREDLGGRRILKKTDLGRNDPSGNRQTPVGPSNLLPFSFHLSFYFLRPRPPPPPGRHLNRKGVVKGKSEDFGGRGIFKKKQPAA